MSWKDARYAANKDGWRRGEKGYAKGGQWDSDAGHSWCRSKGADIGKQYGPVSGGGNQGNFPSGKLRDSFKGSVGID